MYRISILIIVFVGFNIVQAQNETNIEYPTVGKKCPDMVLQHIKYFNRKKASLNEFNGKWLILDFWNKHCAACVASFPKVNALQKQFADRVQFMLVGIQDPENEIEKKYEVYRVREKLTIPCSFDSTLPKRWNIYTAPHIIVIDDHGIVQGITDLLYADQILEFLKGGRPELASTYKSENPNDTTDHRLPFDASRGFLMDGNGGADSVFLFRSILAKFNFFKQQQFVPDSIGEFRRSNRFQVLGVPLFELFNYAYFGVRLPSGSVFDTTHGRYKDFPVLEISDSSIFQYSLGDNKNLFSYSLSLPSPDSTIENFQKAMQCDLMNYFGYEASVEIRKFDCWEIRTTEKARENLMAKEDGKVWVKATKSGYKAKNFPFNTFLNNLYLTFQQEVIFDSSGIVGNIDFTLNNAAWTSVEDARKSLASIGVDLVPSKRKMKVVVIRPARKYLLDKKNDNVSSINN